MIGYVLSVGRFISSHTIKGLMIMATLGSCILTLGCTRHGHRGWSALAPGRYETHIGDYTTQITVTGTNAQNQLVVEYRAGDRGDMVNLSCEDGDVVFAAWIDPQGDVDGASQVLARFERAGSPYVETATYAAGAKIILQDTDGDGFPDRRITKRTGFRKNTELTEESLVVVVHSQTNRHEILEESSVSYPSTIAELRDNTTTGRGSIEVDLALPDKSIPFGVDPSGIIVLKNMSDDRIRINNDPYSVISGGAVVNMGLAARHMLALHPIGSLDELATYAWLDIKAPPGVTDLGPGESYEAHFVISERGELYYDVPGTYDAYFVLAAEYVEFSGVAKSMMIRSEPVRLQVRGGKGSDFAALKNLQQGAGVKEHLALRLSFDKSKDAIILVASNTGSAPVEITSNWILLGTGGLVGEHNEQSIPHDRTKPIVIPAGEEVVLEKLLLKGLDVASGSSVQAKYFTHRRGCVALSNVLQLP